MQVRALSSFLDMEGFDRPPFSALQLQSFHCHVQKQLDQERDTVDRLMVRRRCCATAETLSTLVFSFLLCFPCVSHGRSGWQEELRQKEQQKQQSMDEMRDKKTGLERTVELKRDLQTKKQQELRSVRAELQRLEGSGGRLQELDSELARAVGV